MKTNSSNVPIVDVPPEPSTLPGKLATAGKTGFGLFRSVFDKAQKAGRVASRGKRKRVLLIESEEVAKLILRETMESAGLEVELASNGCQALQKISSAGLDAILMDLTIGGMRGTELIARARECSSFSNRPVYVFTCCSPGREAANAPIPGASKVFNKFATSPGQVVTALAEELMGAGKSAPSRAGAAPDEAELAALNKISGLIKETLGELYHGLQLLAAGSSGGELGRATWKALRSNVGSSVSCLAVAGRSDAARLAAALNMFLAELCDDPEQVAEQEWRTACSAMELIGSACESPVAVQGSSPSEFKVVVIAEAAAELRCEVNEALMNAGLNPVWLAQPDQALMYLESDSADLAILDAAAPAAGYMALKIDELSSHRRPAVLLVTSRPETTDSPKAIALNATAELVLKALMRVEQSRESNPHVSASVAAPAPALEPVEWPASAIVDDAVTQELNPEPAAPAPVEQQPEQEAGNETGDAAQGSQAEEMSEPHAAEAESNVQTGELSSDADNQPTESGEAPTHFEQEREMLMAQIIQNETQLEEVRTQLERQSETHRRLENELESARDIQEQMEKRLAEQARSTEEALKSRSELQSQLEGASAAAEQASQAQKEEAERCARLEQEIACLRQSSTAGPERQTPAQADSLQGPAEVKSGEPDELKNSEQECRIRTEAAALAHLTAEMETERGERQRTEQRAAHLASQLEGLHGELSRHLELERRNQNRISDLEQQLRAGEKALARTSAELEEASSGCQLAEEHVRMLEDSSAQLEKTVSLFEAAKLGFQRTRQDLESRLEAALSAGSESDARLQKESAEGRRLAEALQAAESKAQQQSQKHAIALAKLQSDLELEGFERKRLEAEVLRFQQSTTESNRAGAAQGKRLRRQVRQHVNELRQTACGLLQAELPGDLKKLAEALLGNVISLETLLQEPETSGAGPNAARSDSPS